MGSRIAALEKPRQGMLFFSPVLLETWNIEGSPSRASEREPGLAELILQALPEILFEVSEQGMLLIISCSCSGLRHPAEKLYQQLKFLPDNLQTSQVSGLCELYLNTVIK